MRLLKIAAGALALAVLSAAPLAPQRALAQEDLNYPADDLPFSAAEIVKSFGFDREQRVEVAAGETLALSETLQVFELPDFDPLELREEMSFVWSVDGLKAADIANADSWDAMVKVPRGTKPGNYRLKLTIGYKDAKRSIDRPIEVTAP